MKEKRWTPLPAEGLLQPSAAPLAHGDMSNTNERSASWTPSRARLRERSVMRFAQPLPVASGSGSEWCEVWDA